MFELPGPFARSHFPALRRAGAGGGAARLRPDAAAVPRRAEAAGRRRPRRRAGHPDRHRRRARGRLLGLRHDAVDAHPQPHHPVPRRGQGRGHGRGGLGDEAGPVDCLQLGGGAHGIGPNPVATGELVYSVKPTWATPSGPTTSDSAVATITSERRGQGRGQGSKDGCRHEPRCPCGPYVSTTGASPGPGLTRTCCSASGTGAAAAAWCSRPSATSGPATHWQAAGSASSERGGRRAVELTSMSPNRIVVGRAVAAVEVAGEVATRGQTGRQGGVADSGVMPSYSMRLQARCAPTLCRFGEFTKPHIDRICRPRLRQRRPPTGDYTDGRGRL